MGEEVKSLDIDKTRVSGIIFMLVITLVEFETNREVHVEIL